MRIRLFLLFAFLLSIPKLHGQALNLSQSQKVSDFLYLFDALENNYPFFGVKERVYQMDWLSNKNTYLNRIKHTQNDVEFIREIKSIIGDLKDGHVSFSPTLYHSNYIKVYKQITAKRGNAYYQPWINELEQVEQEKTAYWKSILDSLKSQKLVHKKEEKQAKTSNDDDHLQLVKCKDTKTAIVKIRTFNHFNIKKDQDTIYAFLNEISNYKSLIIDIQDNQGGSTSYWRDNLVSKLINDTVFYKSYIAIRNGNYTKQFYKHLPEEQKNIEDIGFKGHFPSELKSGDFYITEGEHSIAPNNPVGFKGQIYLLVDRKVFSSAESFAIFCKASNWAVVAGEQTNGGGGGTDSIVLALPQSGIIINFSGDMPLNPDFSINEEVKTIPDIEIAGKTKEEKLNALLKFIEDKSDL